MNDNPNAMQYQSAQSSSHINWERLEALMASVLEQSKEADKRLEESRKEADKRLEKSRKEADKQFQKTQRLLDKMIQRVDKATDNIDRNVEQITKHSDQFFSQSGHIVEGLMEPSAFRTLRDSGFDVTQCCREMEGSDPKSGMSMEVDLFFMDTVEAIAVEVKTYCTMAKINRFLKKMANFKTIFPKYGDMKIYVAMAAIKFTKEALECAREKGVLVIRAKDDLFSIVPFGKENLKTF